MAAEIDDVVLRLRVDLDAYLNGVRLSTRTVDQQLGLQERRARSLETQMRKSSNAIGTTIKGLAATLATAFSGRELVGLIDGFTRLQNSLKVAGLEGESLLDVQERLRAISSTYGVEIEALGQVFSRASLAQKELGASTEEIIRLNEIIAAGLKITGTSSQEASGALLQLGQALGSGVVRAEEFNSILEGALPIAQAAARGIDGFGGSVSKLRAAVADGQITSAQFFQGVLKGGIQTIKDAEGATLTLGGAFTVLRNELTLYVGTAAQTSGATTAIADGIRLLADNLDRIIPALTVIGGVAFGRFVLGAVASSRALQVLSAYSRIATTSLAGTALAAQGAGAALLRAFGGPVGLAITALTVGLIAVRAEFDRATDASADYAASSERLGKISKRTAELTEQLAIATGRAREEAVANAKAHRAEAEAYLATARAAVAAARAKATAAKQEVANAVSRADPRTLSGFAGGLAGVGGVGVPGINFGDVNNAGRQKARTDNGLAKAIQLEKKAQKELDAIDAVIRASAVPSAPIVAKPPKATSASAATGTSAAEIGRRQADEIARLGQEELQARIALTEDATDRAALQRELLESEYQQRRAQIENDTEFTKEQKAAQIAYLDRLYGSSGLNAGGEIQVNGGGLLDRAVGQDEARQLREQELELAALRYQAATDALQDAYALADTEAERRKIALDIVDAEFEYRDSVLERIKNSADLSKAIRDAAELEQKGLRDNQPGRRAAAARDNETPMQRYQREIADVDTALGNIQVNALRSLNSELANATKNALGLKGALGDVVGALIELAIRQAVIAPLANGGGVSGVFAAIGSLFGAAPPARASGGPVAPGQVYRINEGASPGRVEGFVGPSTGGQIVPLGRMNAARGGQQPVSGTIRLELSGDIDARMINIAGPVAVEVVRGAAPSIVDAGAAEALRRSSRPRI